MFINSSHFIQAKPVPMFECINIEIICIPAEFQIVQKPEVLPLHLCTNQYLSKILFKS